MQTFADGRGTFQHDHAPSHNSKLIKNFTQENNVNILDWPVNSPDLNPIENLWSLVKRRLGKVECSTKAIDCGWQKIIAVD